MSGGTAKGVAPLVAAVMVVIAVLWCGISPLVQRHNRKQAEARAEQDYATAPAPEVALASPSALPAKLSLPAYPAGNVALDGTTWPRACSLLTDDDVRAFFPQADEITHVGKPDDLAFETKVHLPSGLAFTKERRTVSVPEQSCEVGFWLPHKWVAHRSPIGGRERIATLTVLVRAAGDPTAVKEYFAFHYLNRSKADDEFAMANGAWGCGTFVGYICTKGALSLEVSGRLYATDRLADYGEFATLQMSGQAGTAASGLYEQRVIPAVMARLLSKVP